MNKEVFILAQQQRQAKISIRLEYEEPTLIDIDRYEIPVLAIVARGEDPVDGEEVKFFHGNQEDGSSTTDANGRAEHIFEAQASTRRLRFGAQIRGAYKNISVQLPAPKPKSRPYNLEVKLFKEQNYVFYFFLYNKEGRGCEGKVLVITKDINSVVVDIDESGRGELELINLSLKIKRRFHFEVLGQDIEADFNFNPKKFQRQKE